MFLSYSILLTLNHLSLRMFICFSSIAIGTAKLFFCAQCRITPDDLSYCSYLGEACMVYFGKVRVVAGESF